MKTAGAVSIALALSLSTAITNAARGSTSIEADAVAGAVMRVAPLQSGATRVPAFKDADGTITANSARTSIAVRATLNAEILLSSAASAPAKNIRLGLPKTGARLDATIASDGTVAFSANGSSESIAVQGFQDGVRVLTVLNSRDSRSEFSYPVETIAGARMATQGDGSVLVIGVDGSLIGGFAPPWAKDRNGLDVPTRYEVRGNTVVQVVDHRSAAIAYPVVADPYLFIDLIDHAAWTYNSGYGWTLQVSPTTWGRLNAGSYIIGVYGWDELYSKYRNRGLNTNLNGMRDQYICHVMFVAWKNTYNLDEWRPNVGWLQTVNSSCNPGGPVFFD